MIDITIGRKVNELNTSMTNSETTKDKITLYDRHNSWPGITYRPSHVLWILVLLVSRDGVSV